MGRTTRTTSTTGKSGFTLIELLVAIGVVIILLAMLLPAVRGARINTRTAATKALLRDIETSLDHYAAEFGELPPDGNTALKRDLEATEFRNFSQKELNASDQIVDAFYNASDRGLNIIYYDEIEGDAYERLIPLMLPPIIEASVELLAPMIGGTTVHFTSTM